MVEVEAHNGRWGRAPALARASHRGPENLSSLGQQQNGQNIDNGVRLNDSVSWQKGRNSFKFGADVTAYADSDNPLTRYEAQRIAEGAIDADARQRAISIFPLEGNEIEVRPSLSSLQVIRLLDQVPAPETSL